MEELEAFFCSGLCQHLSHLTNSPNILGHIYSARIHTAKSKSPQVPPGSVSRSPQGTRWQMSQMALPSCVSSGEVWSDTCRAWWSANVLRQRAAFVSYYYECFCFMRCTSVCVHRLISRKLAMILCWLFVMSSLTWGFQVKLVSGHLQNLDSIGQCDRRRRSIRFRNWIKNGC